MNPRSMVLVLTAALVLVLSRTGAAHSPAPKGYEHCTLGVPNIKQLGDFLCWAACTEMVMKYYHMRDTNAPVWIQCDLAKANYKYINVMNPALANLADNITCPCDTFNRLFDSTGMPFMYGMGILPQYYRVTSYGAIAWDTLESLLSRHIPVVFQWNALGFDTTQHAAQHVMVAEGCSHSSNLDNSLWVSVNDPEPPIAGAPRGHHMQIAYNEFNYTTRGFTPWSHAAEMTNKGSVWFAEIPAP